MDISVLYVAELRDAEAAASLSALKLGEIGRVIEEVPVGGIKMHERLLKRLAVDLLEPVKAFGALEGDEVLCLLGVVVTPP